MNAHFARGGRRRRVLHDDARTAAGLYASSATSADASAETPRYGEMASVEHHPQITDYVPRRKRAALATLACGATIAAGAVGLTHAAPGLAEAVPGVSAAQLAAQFAGGIVAWTSAIALLAVAGLARLIFSLRRHRVDDVRGRYRVWKWIIAGGLGLSVNAVIGLHQLASGVAVALSGWSLTAGGGEWWLAPAALVGAWIGVRLTLETAESRSSLTMFVAATLCYLTAAAGSLGWSPAWLGGWSDALTGALPLVGHAFALAGMMLFARYVVLDVQGLIEHAPRPAAKAAAVPKVAAAKMVAPAAAPAPRREPEPAPPQSRPAAESADEDDEEEDGAPGRYLSKSERKRLRKQQRRAA